MRFISDANTSLLKEINWRQLASEATACRTSMQLRFLLLSSLKHFPVLQACICYVCSQEV